MDAAKLPPLTSVVVHYPAQNPPVTILWMVGAGPRRLWQSDKLPALRDDAMQMSFDWGFAVVDEHPITSEHTMTTRFDNKTGGLLWWKCTCGLKSPDAPEQ